MEPRAHPETERRRRLWPILAAILLVLALPATMLWSTVTWTNRSSTLHRQSDAVALAGAGALRDAVNAGSSWREARAAASRAALAETKVQHLGSSTWVQIAIRGRSTAAMSVRVEIHRNGVTSPIAHVLTGDDVTKAVSVAALRSCKDTPHLA
jgi:hypothetical protein